jgi:hypothetical protein
VEAREELGPPRSTVPVRSICGGFGPEAIVTTDASSAQLIKKLILVNDEPR